MGPSRQRNSKKGLVAALGVILAAGIAGSAFAASIPTGNEGAGQGVTVTSGYSANTVTYSGGWTNTSASSSSDLITQVQFVLRTTADGTGTSSVTNTNSNAYVQVMTAGNYGNWATCTVEAAPVAGRATCPLSGSQQIAMSSITGVNIVVTSK